VASKAAQLASQREGVLTQLSSYMPVVVTLETSQGLPR
jgi:hypothetical protein